ncbi:MAG: nucleoside triphosphate pyrophosphatase [Steroidobacteraceae bacterium]
MNSQRSTPNSLTRLVLASTSIYRRQLLERLQLPFTVHSPGIDETPLPGEDITSLVYRLAKAKAEAVATRYPDSVIIGSDQAAVRGATILGKPGTAEAAMAQLKAASGAQIVFHTAIHVIAPQQQRHEAHIDATIVKFRTLSDEEIARYIAAENPLDCAGAFKAEALGITLFERIDSQDPTALTGLPLIWLAGALRRAGFLLP